MATPDHVLDGFDTEVYHFLAGICARMKAAGLSREEMRSVLGIEEDDPRWEMDCEFHIKHAGKVPVSK